MRLTPRQTLRRLWRWLWGLLPASTLLFRLRFGGGAAGDVAAALARSRQLAQSERPCGLPRLLARPC
jgi:hypothetical protein